MKGEVSVTVVVIVSCGANSNCPDTSDAPPVLGTAGGSVELTANDVQCLVRLALLKRLTDTEDDLEIVVDGSGCLFGHLIVSLLEDGAALRVAQDDPWNTCILELAHRHLARKGARRLVVCVLPCNGDGRRLEHVLDEQEVERGRRDYHLRVGVDVGIPQRLDELLATLDGAVHLPVAADKELACHDG